MQRIKEKYEALRKEARECFGQFIERVREDPRAQKDDHRIFVLIANELGIDKDIVISYVRDLMDESALVDYQEGIWTDKEGEVYINPPHLAKIVSHTREQIYYYLRKNSWEPLELLTNLPYNRTQKYYKLRDVCPPHCYLRYKNPDMTFKQFLVFFTMITWKTSFGYWPTNRQIQTALRKRYGFSLWCINDLVRRLQEIGYITVINKSAYRGPKEVIINKGLERLLVSGAFRRNNKLLKELRHKVG